VAALTYPVLYILEFPTGAFAVHTEPREGATAYTLVPYAHVHADTDPAPPSYASPCALCASLGRTPAGQVCPACHGVGAT
jgi:hypothetical protein